MPNLQTTDIDIEETWGRRKLSGGKAHYERLPTAHRSPTEEIEGKPLHAQRVQAEGSSAVRVPAVRESSLHATQTTFGPSLHAPSNPCSLALLAVIIEINNSQL